MPNLNKVMLMGNLTRDPELRFTPSNTAVVKLGLAVNRRWRNQNGEQQEETTFVDCTAFGRTGEVLNQYLRKGRPVFIEGRLHLNQWEDQQGQKRSKLEVVVEGFQFIDSRQGGGDGGAPDGGPAVDGGYGQQGGGYGGGPRGNAGPRGGGRQAAPPPPSAGPHEAIEEDDIPF